VNVAVRTAGEALKHLACGFGLAPGRRGAEAPRLLVLRAVRAAREVRRFSVAPVFGLASRRRGAEAPRLLVLRAARAVREVRRFSVAPVVRRGHSAVPA
jgi:hypothetical protein